MAVSVEQTVATLRARASAQRAAQEARAKIVRDRLVHSLRTQLPPGAGETSALLEAWGEKATLGRAELTLVAANLHGYYTALETLCERVARQLDENVSTGASWHADLLFQMQVEVPGCALVSSRRMWSANSTSCASSDTSSAMLTCSTSTRR